MNFARTAVAGLAVAAALITGMGGDARAQDDRSLRPDAEAEAIIYRNAGYNGPAVNVSRAQPDLGLSWTVTSIRVRSGRWELCERPDYQGVCRTFIADNPIIMRDGIRVQSMRPLGWTDQWAPGDNPSMQGRDAQFYPAPARHGRRVAVCLTGQSQPTCAARAADQFCRTMGYDRAAHSDRETLGRRVYLSDTLCVGMQR